MASIPVYRGSFDAPEAERLLWRAGFGPRKGDAARLAKDPHDLALRRSATGARTYLMPEVSPGDDRSISFRLYPGRYELWCTVADHRVRGMRATLTVTR